jgi:uncharacterized membrane protein
MATTYHHSHKHERSTEPGHGVQIRKVDSDQALLWIEAGWHDFLNAPGHGLLYGVLFSLFCIGMILLTQGFPGFVVAFITGLMLVGPLLAVGAYSAARQLQQGQPVSIAEGLRLVKSRISNLSLFGAILLVVMIAWVRLASLLFAIEFQLVEPSWSAFGDALLSSVDGLMVLGFFVLMGFVLAAAVFIVSATSIPMILDRDTNVMRAVQYSYQAVMANKGAMAFWAFMIVVLCGIGIASGFILMALVFPVLGYATWHSYQDLIE